MTHFQRNLIIQLKSLEKSGDLDETEKELVTTTDTVVKEGNNDTLEKKEKKLLWQRKPSILLFQKKIRLTQSTKDRNHKHPIKQ